LEYLTDSSFNCTFIKITKTLSTKKLILTKENRKNYVIQYLLMNDEKETGKVTVVYNDNKDIKMFIKMYHILCII